MRSMALKHFSSVLIDLCFPQSCTCHCEMRGRVTACMIVQNSLLHMENTTSSNAWKIQVQQMNNKTIITSITSGQTIEQKRVTPLK